MPEKRKDIYYVISNQLVGVKGKLFVATQAKMTHDKGENDEKDSAINHGVCLCKSLPLPCPTSFLIIISSSSSAAGRKETAWQRLRQHSVPASCFIFKPNKQKKKREKTLLSVNGKWTLFI